MRTTLALALVRAELCRARAAERQQPPAPRMSLRAVLGRTLRSLKTKSPAPHQSAPASEASPAPR